MIFFINKIKLLNSIKFDNDRKNFIYKGMRVKYGGYLYSEQQQIYVHYFMLYRNCGSIGKTSAYEYSNRDLTKVEIKNMGETLVDIDPDL